VDACNRLLLCSSRDPKLSGCPISSRRQKTDLRYLSAQDLDRYAHELRRIRLATYRYRGASGPTRLGFVLEDLPPGAVVDPERDMADLYGYTSLAVAALQAQAREIDALKSQVAELRRTLATRDRREGGATGR
jgi:ribosomal protein L29